MSFPLSTGVKGITKEAEITLALTRAPFDIYTDAVHKGAYFFSDDATGCFWGVHGYYRTIPCWRDTANGAACYQASSFELVGPQCFRTDMLLDNPYLYGAALSATTNVKGQLTHPTGGNLQQAVRGFSGVLNTNRAAVNTSGPYAGQITNRQNIPIPPLYFENLVLPFAPRNETRLEGATSSVGPIQIPTAVNPSQSFVIMDDFFNEVIVDNVIVFFPGTSSGFAPAAGNFPTPNGASVLTVMKNGINCMINGFNRFGVGITASIKINPITGNFVMQGNPWGTNTAYCGNVFYPVSLISTTFEIDQIILSDPADSSLLLTKFNQFRVQQAAGGGFMLNQMFQKPWTTFLIKDDLSSYIKINIETDIADSTFAYPQIAMGYSGEIYFIAANDTLYWTGDSATPIILKVPPLIQAGVACQFPSCNPW